MLNPLFRELHRLRKHIRDAQAEIERGPRVSEGASDETRRPGEGPGGRQGGPEEPEGGRPDRRGADQVAEPGSGQAREATRRPDRSAGHRGQAARHRQHQGADRQAGGRVLAAMADVDERTAKIPGVEAAVAKAKADFAVYEKDAAERHGAAEGGGRRGDEGAGRGGGEDPARRIRGQYDRLVKAHGADAMAADRRNSRVRTAGSGLPPSTLRTCKRPGVLLLSELRPGLMYIAGRRTD